MQSFADAERDFVFVRERASDLVRTGQPMSLVCAPVSVDPAVETRRWTVIEPYARAVAERCGNDVDYLYLVRYARMAQDERAVRRGAAQRRLQEVSEVLIRGALCIASGGTRLGASRVQVRDDGSIAFVDGYGGVRPEE